MRNDWTEKGQRSDKELITFKTPPQKIMNLNSQSKKKCKTTNRREREENSEEDMGSTSDLGSELSEASGYTIDSTESQTLSDPFSSNYNSGYP